MSSEPRTDPIEAAAKFHYDDSRYAGTMKTWSELSEASRGVKIRRMGRSLAAIDAAERPVVERLSSALRELLDGLDALAGSERGSAKRMTDARSEARAVLAGERQDERTAARIEAASKALFVDRFGAEGGNEYADPATWFRYEAMLMLAAADAASAPIAERLADAARELIYSGDADAEVLRAGGDRRWETLQRVLADFDAAPGSETPKARGDAR